MTARVRDWAGRRVEAWAHGGLFPSVERDLRKIVDSLELPVAQ